jgi:hypothetical protein
MKNLAMEFQHCEPPYTDDTALTVLALRINAQNRNDCIPACIAHRFSFVGCAK